MQPFGTILLLLLSSAALVLLGHVFRLLRWEQFIRIYEYPQRRSLLRAMAGGYAVNFLLPFHVGDFLRAALAGRKMKTGTGFAFATVIMDRFLDVWVVALLFGGFRLAGLGGAAVLGAARYYLVFALLLAAALTVIPCAAALTERRTLEWRTVLAERRVVAEELLEVTRHARRIDGRATLNVNTHHRWHHFFEHRCQAWHLLRGCCRRRGLGCSSSQRRQR